MFAITIIYEYSLPLSVCKFGLGEAIVYLNKLLGTYQHSRDITQMHICKALVVSDLLTDDKLLLHSRGGIWVSIQNQVIIGLESLKSILM